MIVWCILIVGFKQEIKRLTSACFYIYKGKECINYKNILFFLTFVPYLRPDRNA